MSSERPWRPERVPVKVNGVAAPLITLIVPAFEAVLAPVTLPEKIVEAASLKVRVPRLVTSPVIVPEVVPSPICSLPAEMIVPPV
ncbi:hypothetical protein AFCDBAGC_1265 [Methylobacterium cerastii]|uniref:Uncharacterized protein n=1 Tax=Methylobacterium cerastii TaxID=932741 RepID=A0ABQ4QDX7_9HYPH|nr:hypothetical protein AFCDBAGC_1265 [Methylobacterium cerastii]